MAFNPVDRAPGVYIEEVTPAGPIAGVGTSTAAFIGPAKSGPIGRPVKITGWQQFINTFGDYMTSPDRYLAHAVQGYFLNGGRIAYILRVGTAKRSFKEFDDAAGTGKSIRIEALADGKDGDNIKISIKSASIVPDASGTKVCKTSVTIASNKADNSLEIADEAAKYFVVGDKVLLTKNGTKKLAEITGVKGKTIYLNVNLETDNKYKDGTIRIADLETTTTTLRVNQREGLEPGSVITLVQKVTQPDGTQVVKSKSGVISAFSGKFVTLDSKLGEQFSLDPAEQDVLITSNEFTLSVQKTTPEEVRYEEFKELSLDVRHSQFFAWEIKSKLITATLPEKPSTATPPLNLPALRADVQLSGGEDDFPSALTTKNYKDAITALKEVDDVNMICIPDETSQDVQVYLRDHCEALKDRMAILDPWPNAEPSNAADSIESQREKVMSDGGYAALYYPRIRIANPLATKGQAWLNVSPSGHLAGIFARTDSEVGVHKAPANEMIRGAMGLEWIGDPLNGKERRLTDDDQGPLNEKGINVLRIFPGNATPVVWGARTTALLEQTAWRYINVRRLFMYVEESIQEGIRWAVFEPIDLGLWKKLKRTISEFLTRVWRDGALFGATAEQAFYVKIDEDNNPPDVRELGRVNIEIGLAPVRPAEFIVIRIGMWRGGAEVTELL